MQRKLHAICCVFGIILLIADSIEAQSVLGKGPELAGSRGGTQSQKLVAAARWQVGKTLTYDPAYVGLEYPGGDLPIEKGVCTDVVIRALRKGCGIDLQKVVHEDMLKHFSKYPKNWGLKRTDKSIDHRRVPNLKRYFKRQGWSMPVTDKAADYQPGDLVTCTVAGRLPHIMIVSDKRGTDGRLMVIHNIGSGAREESSLFEYPLTGHYRVGALRSD
ncbi:MAG: hypothetical protein ACI9FG_002034 [Crocinitomicaceae bacterium]|jgi:uncharacterized protein YijF (DUF1287 family)